MRSSQLLDLLHGMSPATGPGSWEVGFFDPEQFFYPGLA